MRFLQSLCLTLTLIGIVSGRETDVRDLCTRHGIFKLTDEFYVPETIKTNVVIDLKDYFLYTDRIEKYSKDFLVRIREYLDDPDSSPLTFVGEVDDKAIFKLADKIHLGHTACESKHGFLANLDKRGYSSVLINIANSSNSDYIPIDAFVNNNHMIISRGGRSLGAIIASAEETIKSKFYIRLTKENQIGIASVVETSSDSAVILCMKNKNPFDQVSDKDKTLKSKWIRRSERFANNLETIVTNFKKIKEEIGRLSTSTREVGNNVIRSDIPSMLSQLALSLIHI